MPKGYTTKEKIEEFLNTTVDPSIDIDFYIETAENLIDKLTGRNFIADDTASERLFDGDSTDTLLIDDCIEVTKVERGQDTYGQSFEEISAGGSSGYFKYPQNHNVKGIPITKLLLINKRWPCGNQNNRITPKWGYSEEVPADISFAATVIAGGMYNAERGGGTGDIKQERIGNYSVTYDVGAGSGGSWSSFERAKTIINNYKKWAL